jgi:hypothetical protein
VKKVTNEDNRTAVALLLLIFVSLTADAQSNAQFIVSADGRNPSICVSDSGKIHIVWISPSLRGGGSGSDSWVFHTRFDANGKRLTDTNKVSTVGLVQKPKIASLKESQLCVWVMNIFAENSYVRARLINEVGDTVGNEYEINDPYYDALRAEPKLCVITDSSYAVVWGGNGPQTPSPLHGIYAEIVSADLKGIGGNVLLSDNPIPSTTISNPIVASNRKSVSILFGWLDRNSPGNNIRIRFFDKNLSALDTSYALVSDTSLTMKYMWSPCAGMDSAGNVSIAWSAQQSVGGWNVYMYRLDRQGVPKEEKRIVNTRPASYPSVRIWTDDEGKSVLVWDAWEGQRSQIWGQRYDKDGVAIGGNFLVSQPSDTVDLIFPDVVLRSDTIYIVWQSAEKVLAKVIGFYESSLRAETQRPSFPINFTLYQNFPNPFNPSTTITFDLPASAFVTLKVYDVLGREVSRLVNETKTPGSHAVKWDASQFPSGIYFARLEVAGRVLARKMCLVK